MRYPVHNSIRPAFVSTFPLICLTILSVPLPKVRAEINFTVIFDDPGAQYADYYNPIEVNLIAAADAWAQLLAGDANIEVRVAFANIESSFGRSLTSVFVGELGNVSLFEQGIASEIRTGVDPNGPEPDAEWVVGQSYLQNELWFDPDPRSGSGTIPDDRTDAYSVLLHEIGHMLAYNGWRDHFDGSLPGNFMSTFDALTLFDGQNFFFTGTSAATLYGGPVPQTFGNIFHLGNETPLPGSDLLDQLMNGVVFLRGTRYVLSPLDADILADIGVSVRDSADINGDGNVDLADFHLLFGCTTPPGVPISPNCQSADLDGDGDVDYADFAVFQHSY